MIASDSRSKVLGTSKTQTFGLTRRIGDIRISIQKSHFAKKRLPKLSIPLVSLPSPSLLKPPNSSPPGCTGAGASACAPLSECLLTSDATVDVVSPSYSIY